MGSLLLSGCITTKKASQSEENTSNTSQETSSGDEDQPEPGDVYITVPFNNSDTLRLRAHNCVVEGNSVVVKAGQYGYFVNADPVDNGFSVIESRLVNSNYFTVETAIFCSYNRLTLDKIKTGYYQDLAMMANRFSGNDRLSTLIPEYCPQMAESRYFLSLLYAADKDVLITDVRICSGDTPVASKDPAIQFTDFTANEKALINECFGMDIPFLGTRAYRMSQETVSEMKTLMFEGMFLPANYLNNFTSNGFELVQDIGRPVYQKVVEDKVYTITFASTGSPLNYYQLVFTKDYPSLKPGEWPSGTINQYLSTDFASFINDHPFTETGYSYTGIGRASTDFDHAVSILLKNDNKDKAAIISDVTKYLQSLKDVTSNYEFVLEEPEESEYYYSLNLHDAHFEHNVALMVVTTESGNNYYLTISQQMTVSEFPVEYIRKSLNLDESFEIDGYNDPGARYYVSYSGGNLLQVYIYDTTATNYANNLQALRNKGYISAKRDLEPNSIYFRKAFFDDYCITARLVEDYYCFDYSYNCAFGDLYDNMSDVVERFAMFLETMRGYVFPEIDGTHKCMYVNDNDSWEIEQGKVKLASGAYISNMTKTDIESVFTNAHYTYDSENGYYITDRVVHHGEQTITLVIELSMYDENTVYLNFREIYGN